MIATSVKCRYLCKVSFYVGISIREEIQTAMKVSKCPFNIHKYTIFWFPIKNHLIPRQLVGWSWLWRNSQQASLTSPDCYTLENIMTVSCNNISHIPIYRLITACYLFTHQVGEGSLRAKDSGRSLRSPGLTSRTATWPLFSTSTREV